MQTLPKMLNIIIMCFHEKLGKLSGISIKKIDEEIIPIIKPPINIRQTRQRKSMKAATKISEQQLTGSTSADRKSLHEPQVNLTVFVKGGGKAKALDFTGMHYI